jgi:glucose/arabinose dehydrogenase
MLWSPASSAAQPGGIQAVKTSRIAVALATIALLAPAQPVAAALPLTEVAPAHSFDMPLYLTHARDSRLFVLEQKGKIKVIQSDGVTVSTFLDLSSRVSQGGGERGLLGLAFHPMYASNGLFYVNYTRQSDGDTVIAEYKRSSGNANSADFNSERILLTINQPAGNHNGGWMGFRNNGPLLFIATGDGGGSGDPWENGQDLNSLLGKILRIDPLDPDGSGPRRYRIPPKNPYVGRSGLDEIWARGLRNPWRCSFDRYNGRLWCSDVGQDDWEEVNRVKTGRGVNFGWDVMEGLACYEPASGCNKSGKVKPIAVYSHSIGCSVTGGYVSRRSGAALYGTYIFADYCVGRVWGIPHNFSGTFSTSGHLLADTSYNVSSFGEDNAGRLYLIDLGGHVFRLNGS